MNKEDPYRQQADKHKQRITKAGAESGDSSTLPPRSRAHRKTKKKTSVKLKYPVIRLLVLFFVLLPVTVLSIYSYFDGNEAEKATARGGYEKVSLDVEKSEQPGKREHEEKTIEEDSGEDGKENSAVSGVEVNGAQESEVKETGGEGKDSGTERSQEAGNNAKSQETAGQDSAGKVIYHTVKPGETVFRIAMMYYKSQAGIEIIRNANGLNGNEIKTGQTLKIPVK